MAFKNHSPGCACCECRRYFQSFLNAAIVDTPYTVTGDVGVALGIGWLFYGDGKAISDRERTAAKQAWVWTIAEISETRPPADCIVYLYLLYADEDNYLAVKITYVAGGAPGSVLYKGQLVECVAGAESVIDEPTRSVPNWTIGGTLNVCIDDDEVVVSIAETTFGRPVYWMRGTMTDRASLGGFHGLEIIDGDAANTSTGTAWKSIEEVQLSSACIICQCTQCSKFTAPKTIDITIAGVVTMACADCPDYNDTWRLYDEKPVDDSVTDQIRACTWVMQRPQYAGCVAGFGYERLELSVANGLAQFTLAKTFQQDSQMWIGSAPIDCANVLDGLVIPLFGYIAASSGGTQQCMLGFDDTISDSTVGDDITPGTISLAYDYTAFSTWLAVGDLISIQTAFNWTYGRTEEFYTIASVSFGAPTVITLDRKLPASRTGYTMRRHATATLTVIA